MACVANWLAICPHAPPPKPSDDHQMAIVLFVANVNDGILILFPLAPGVGAMRRGDLVTHNAKMIRLNDALRGDECQIGVPNANLIIALERVGFADLTSIDKGAVARKIVFDQTTSITIHDDGMGSANGIVLDDNVADRVGADAIIARV